MHVMKSKNHNRVRELRHGPIIGTGRLIVAVGTIALAVRPSFADAEQERIPTMMIRLRAPETDGGQMWAGVMKIVRENRNAFDDVWLSTGINFPKLEWHAGQSARHVKAAADLRALGIGVSVQYQAATGLDAAEVENLK